MVKQLKDVKAKVSDFLGLSLVDDKMAAVAPITRLGKQKEWGQKSQTESEEHTNTTLSTYSKPSPTSTMASAYFSSVNTVLWSPLFARMAGKVMFFIFVFNRMKSLLKMKKGGWTLWCTPNGSLGLRRESIAKFLGFMRWLLNTLVAWNWSPWEHLHHKNWQTPQIKAFLLGASC